MENSIKRPVILSAIIIVAVFLVSFASASAIAGELECRINFNIGVLNSMINSSPNASSDLQQSVTTLENDWKNAQALGNANETKDFVKGQYSDDMRNVMSSVQGWRSEKKGITLSDRANLLSSYNELRANYTQCENQAYINLGQERLNDYLSQIAVFQNKTNNLASRGFDVTQLNQLLQDAQNQIITPLQNALSNANDSSSVQAAVKSYCLYNGCENGTNFHLEAKFDATRLSTILASLQANATVFNLSTSDLAEAKSNLTEAQNTLTAVGTSVYQQGQSQTIFGDIRSASKTIVSLMRQALGEPLLPNPEGESHGPSAIPNGQHPLNNHSENETNAENGTGASNATENETSNTINNTGEGQ